jgi:hypothetical protein
MTASKRIVTTTEKRKKKAVLKHSKEISFWAVLNLVHKIFLYYVLGWCDYMQLIVYIL